MKGICWLLLLLLAPAAAADTRALVVAGLGGTADYETAFQRQAKGAADAVRGVADDVTLLLGDMVSRDRVRGELAQLAARSGEADVLLMILIGHGTFDERDYRFNVPGADFTGAELTAWLDGVPAARQLVVVAATSASGALGDVLSRDGRALITATRSGGERNASVFAGFFTAALESPDADTDKDGYVGAVEAFNHAEGQVAEYYRQHREMATEHPTLSGADVTVQLARLEGTGSLPRVAGDERLAELEAAVEALRLRKDEMAADAYYAELQRLMLDIATVRRSGGGGAP